MLDIQARSLPRCCSKVGRQRGGCGRQVRFNVFSGSRRLPQTSMVGLYPSIAWALAQLIVVGAALSNVNSVCSTAIVSNQETGLTGDYFWSRESGQE